MSELNKKYLFSLLGVLLLTAVTFSPVLKAKFLLWDDDVHLTKNVALRSLDQEHLQDIFTQQVNTIYIPLTTLSFALEYRFFGYNPFVYHLNNLLLHLLVIVFAFLFIRKLGFSQTIAFVAILIFAVHPTKVESVAWVTERKDVLYAALYLLSLISYLKYLDSLKLPSNGIKISKISADKISPNYFYFGLSVLLGVLSMLAKPMALSLPLILFLIDWYKDRRSMVRIVIEKLFFAIPIGLICWFGTYHLHTDLQIKNFGEMVLVWLWTFAFYIRQFFVPLQLAPIYRAVEPISFSNYQYILAVLVFTAFWLIFFKLRKNKNAVFLMLFYLLSIFFLWRINTKDINFVADRFLYLPSLGLCVLVGIFIEEIFQDHRSKILKRIMIGVLSVVILYFAFKTNQMTRIWQNSLSLWNYQIKTMPDDYASYNNLATTLRDEKEYRNAEEEYSKILKVASQGYEVDKEKLAQSGIKVEYLVKLYKKSIENNPEYIDAIYNLGKLYADLGLPREALAYYKKAIDINPTYKDAYFGWAGLLVKLGQHSQAIAAYQECMKLFQDNPDVYINIVLAYNEAIKEFPVQKDLYSSAQEQAVEAFIKFINGQKPKANYFFNLGYLYQEMGDMKRSISAYEEALEIQPFHENALYNLGNAYRDAGQFEQALAYYQKSIKANPQKTDAYMNIGSIYSRLGKVDQAKEYFLRATKAGGGSSKAYFNLAFLEESAGKVEEAEKLYLKSVELDPNNAEGYYNLGNLYARLNEEAKALEEFKKAVQVNSSHLDAWVNLSILSFKLKNYQDAVKALDEAILLGYDAPKEYLQELEKYR